MEAPSNARNAVVLVEAESNPLGIALVNTVKTNKMAEPADLVALAQNIQKADEMTKATVGGKLTIIAEQIRFLQEQARKVLEEAKRDHNLSHAACNFVKKPGSLYYLYERQSGQKYFSLLSPQEWGTCCPHEYLGGYRLEYDMSWTPLKNLDKRDQDNAFVDKIINTKLAITDSPQFQFQPSVKEITNTSHATS